ncbi:MAG TPA: hypothetical protein VJT54_00605, partial [Verrucomicrobiae bacterium]|nr:hypothetical protein [Verrucomicrobiae bacterium]
YNQTGALWDIQTNAYITCGICAGDEFFNNAGTFRKSGGPGTSTINVTFTNNATVTNLIGILSFNSGGPLAGTYGTSASAITEFAGGNFTIGIPPLITGLGLCEFIGTTLTLTQNVPTNLALASGNVILGPAFQNGGAISNLTLNGVTLVSTNTVTGTLNWAGGTVSGLLTIANGGVLNITGSVSLDNVLTNAGTVTMSGAGNLTIYNNNSTYKGGIYNQTGALWDIQTNAYITCGICAGDEFFNNAGTFRKSGGPGTSTINVSFTNNATVNALMGILGFNGNFTTTGGTLAFGVSGLSSFGQINVTGNVALNGTANVAWLNGFIPANGNSFALMDYGSHSGTFAAITLPPGSLGQGIYGATVFTLMITNTTAQAPPVFLSIKLVNPSNAVVSWPSSATNYSLQTSTNLAPGSWSNVIAGVTTAGTNYVHTNNVNGKAGFFRLHSP